MYSIMLGYAAFYFLRQNFNMVMPSFQSELGYSKADIGWIISSGAVIYGLGKGLAGLLGDRSNARYLMSFGLFGSALVSFCLGFADSWVALLIFYTLNNCFQSMGWPPCARLLTHWFSPKEIGTKWALWNTSQQLGGAAITILAPYLIVSYGWRYAFFVPGVLCALFAAVLFNRLRDTPESLGLPSIEAHHGLLRADESAGENLSVREIFVQVVGNKLVWFVSLANFFVYAVRMFMINWAPSFLSEFKGSSLKLAGGQVALFDLAGMFGGIIAGRLSDKVFAGRRGPVGAIYMTCLALVMVLLWRSPMDKKWTHFILMMSLGFLVTGPQILVGVAAADFASKKAAGAASGFTGTVGYLGASAAGVGVGVLVDNHGWGAAFATMSACALMGAFFFALTWNGRSKALEKK